MIRINLLPFRATKKTENIKRQITVFAAVLVVLIVGLAWYHLKLSSSIAELNSKIEDVKQKVAKEEKIAKMVDLIKKDLETLNQKIDVIHNLDMKREEAVRFLDLMAETVVAQRMWLTRLEMPGNSVKIEGIALDNKTVADYMTRLQEASYLDADESVQKDGETTEAWQKRLDDSKWFSSVNLQSIRRIDIRNNNLKNFQITCQKKPRVISETGKAEK